MKVFLTLILCVLSFLASAQEPQIIGGYILDGKDSFEELDAAVVTDSKRLDKNLDGKGMKLPGVIMMMNPESVGQGSQGNQQSQGGGQSSSGGSQDSQQGQGGKSSRDADSTGKKGVVRAVIINISRENGSHMALFVIERT